MTLKKFRISIITQDAFIECQIVNWYKLDYKETVALALKISQLNTFSIENGKKFILASKKPLPEVWKGWMGQKKINYTER